MKNANNSEFENKQNLNHDLNKVFVPCRSVLEMEALLTGYLRVYNYDGLKEIQNTRPTSQSLINMLDIQDNKVQSGIIDYFINVTMRKIKPIVMYQREHHGIMRMGNVLPHSKTRNCVYLALERLKMKFLLLKKFLEKFRIVNFDLNYFYNYHDESNKTIISTVFKEFYSRNMVLLQRMLPKSKISGRLRKLMVNKDTITTEKIINLATYIDEDDINYQMKFIMSSIKASLFICKLMFGKMDVQNPFSRAEEVEFDIENKMIEYEFIPGLLGSISDYLRNGDIEQLSDCRTALEFLINKVLDGINFAIEICSYNQVKLDLDETFYYSDNILKY